MRVDAPLLPLLKEEVGLLGDPRAHEDPHRAASSGQPAARYTGPLLVRAAANAKLRQFDAALLSQPIDLSALVTLSQTSVAAFTEDPGLLNRMVDLILNSDKKRGVDKDTRLDVLLVLGNVARVPEDAKGGEIRTAPTGSSPTATTTPSARS